MANEVLGECVCPVCKSSHPQEVRKSEKTGKPYINCDECGCQIFARSAESVKILRSMATLKPAPVVAGQESEKSPEKSPLKPAPVVAGQMKPAPVAVPKPAPVATFFG